MPAFQGSSRPVELARCVERNTGVAVAISATIAVIVAASLIASITGAVIVGVIMVVGYFAERRARAIVRASSLRVGLSQFPEIHACATSFARRLGMEEVPEIYVLDSGEVNGFALKLGKRSGIILTDEAVAACLEGRNPGALAFVIGHELGHVALGHHRWWRRNLSKFLWLSRLDECSADNVGFELVGSREAAEAGVLLLVAGPRLLPYVDRAAARAQARDVGHSRPTRSAERALTHPLAMHRLARVAERMPGATADRRLAA